MAEELGKIEKPEAGKFADKRKLYLVPLLYSWQEAPPEYTEKFELYWQQASEHIANLESKMGKVKYIYHESGILSGEEGLNLLEKISPSSCRIATEKCKSGAQFEAVEDAGLVEESMDWERHLMVGFISQKVAQTVSEMFSEASKKRYEHMAERIDETFKVNEAALLFIREGHQVQFPPDIEVFSVVPPVLDEIRRWFRDYRETPAAEKPENEEKSVADKADDSTDKTDES